MELLQALSNRLASYTEARASTDRDNFVAEHAEKNENVLSPKFLIPEK